MRLHDRIMLAHMSLATSCSNAPVFTRAKRTRRPPPPNSRGEGYSHGLSARSPYLTCWHLRGMSFTESEFQSKSSQPRTTDASDAYKVECLVHMIVNRHALLWIVCKSVQPITTKQKSRQLYVLLILVCFQDDLPLLSLLQLPTFIDTIGMDGRTLVRMTIRVTLDREINE